MDNYDKYKISELLEFCRSRGLSLSYRLKEELIERLEDNDLNGSTHNDESKNSENKNENTHYEDDDVLNDKNNRDTNEENHRDNNKKSNSNNDEDKRDNNEENHRGNNSESNLNNHKNNDEETMAPSISFKDVEDALAKFSGDGHEDVTEWITNFKDIANTCGWSEVQMYLFARKLLAGTARKAVEADKSILTFAALETHLKTEHKDTTTLSDVHNALGKRRKTNNESHLEYFYAMIKIANGRLDELSLVKYIVDGINDDISSKMTLFQSNSVKELKERLKVYEKIMKDVKSQNVGKIRAKSFKNKNDNTKHEDRGSKHIKCFTCNVEGHKTSECPDKAKGRKCYNCDQFGHIAKDCRRPKRQDANVKSKKETMCVESVNKERMRFPIEFKFNKSMSVLDTGSDYTLMRKSFFYKGKFGKLNKSKVWMKGFAPTGQCAEGSTLITFELEKETYHLCFHIVDDNLIPEDVLLGRDFLKMVDVTIKRGIPTITKIVEEVNVAEIFPIDIDVQTVKTEELPCVTAIADNDLRGEIISMIDNYTPRKVESSHIKMELIMQDNIPVYQHPRRLSAAEREVVQSMIDDFLKMGIIRPSKSPWASPILLRKKKNGSYRFCVDYRKLNMKIVKDRYPLPLMDDVIDDLSGNYVYSNLDLKNGFYHVDMDPDSMKYTAFVTPDGHYEFLKSPFGLCNSPAVFQRYINIIFHDAQLMKLLRLYLDDLMVAAKDEITNLNKLKQVVKIAEDNGLIINFNKCNFLQRKINFLGHILENGTISPSTEKTRAVETFPQPRNVKNVQSFLGLTGFFRKFIHQYALKARPLSNLLKKDVKFVFGSEQVAAFNELKQSLCAKPVLRLYNPKADTELHTDASALGYGGCLLQKQQDDGLMHPVHYLSYKTTPAEAKLHSYELEVLAIIECLNRLRPYVLGIHFTIFTDCQAFQQTMLKKNATAKVARWALALEEYDVEVKHRPGRSMAHVDALSRNFVLTIEDDGILLQVRNAQKNDEQCKLTTALLAKGPYENYVLRNEVIYKFRDGHYLLKIPRAMTNEILARIHGDTHISRKRMEITAKQQYDIPDLTKRVDRFVSNCVTCILATKKKGKKDGWLQSIEKADIPMDTYHVDHIGPLESTAKSYKHIFAVIDAFTKFIWLYPVKSTEIAEAIQKLNLQRDIFGNPRRIIADKASVFRSTQFADYCEAENIERHLVTTGTPRGNGQIERMNSIIKTIITKLAINHPSKWYQEVAKVQLRMNSSVSRATKHSPFKLMFGVEMNSPEDEDLNQVLEEVLLMKFDNDRDKFRATASEAIKQIQTENAAQYNKKRKEAHLYVLGDLVAIERLQKGKGQKFYSQMLGPYEVTKVKRNHRYEVQKVGFGDGPINTSVPADRMKPWSSDADSDNDN